MSVDAAWKGRSKHRRRREGVLDAVCVKTGENSRPRRVVAAPQRLDIGQAQLLAQQAPRQRRQKAHDRARLDEARAGHVGDGERALSDRLEQTGRAEPRGRVQLQRIAPVGVDPPPQHVGALQSGDGAHIELAVIGHEVFALDQQQPEITGEIDLFGVGLAEGAGRQQADARIDALRATREAGAKIAEEWSHPAHIHVAEQARDGARHDQPVFQRIAGAGRRLSAVAQHPPSAVGPARDLRRVKTQPAAAGGRDAAHRPDELRRARHHSRRQRAFRDQSAFAVNIAQDEVEQFGALDDSGLDLLPFALREQQRQAGQRSSALARFARRAIGYAHLVDAPVGAGETLVDVGLAELRESA